MDQDANGEILTAFLSELPHVITGQRPLVTADLDCWRLKLPRVTGAAGND